MASGGSRPRARTGCRLVVLLALVTTLAYLPALGNGFVDYDDETYVTGNAALRGGLSATALSWAFTTTRAGNWHPLTWLSHLLDVSLFGLRPAGHHAVSLLLHAASATLLFLFLRRATGRTAGAWLAAALFAVHPLHVESVAWAAERKDVLSGLFFMLTLAAWLRHVRGGGPRAHPRPGSARWYTLSLACFALGLLAKPMLVTLPFVLLLLDWWPLGRMSGPGCDRGTPPWRRVGPLVLEKIPFLLLSLGSSIVTFRVQQSAGAMRSAEFSPLDVRLSNGVTALAAYLRKTLLPADLAVVYPYPRDFPPPGRFAIAAALLLGLSLATVLMARRRPHLFTGWWWFIGMLVPVLGLVQVGFQSMADRYTYLPLVGVFLALAVEGERLAGRGLRWRALLGGTSVAVIAALGALTFRQAALWRDTVTLFTHAVEATEDNWAAHLTLGAALSRAGRVEEGRRHFAEVLRLRPGYFQAHRNLGDLPSREPAAVEARYRVALQLMQKGRESEAADILRELLRVGAVVSEAANSLGVIEAQAGRLGEAEALFRRAVEAGPGNAEARGNLGLLLARQGRLEEAYVRFGEALALAPDNPSIVLDFADALRAGGREAEAVARYRQALRLDPASERARSGLSGAVGQP